MFTLCLHRRMIRVKLLNIDNYLLLLNLCQLFKLNPDVLSATKVDFIYTISIQTFNLQPLVEPRQLASGQNIALLPSSYYRIINSTISLFVNDIKNI